MLNPPDNHDVGLWRYVDLTKFLAMVSSQTLAFVRADCLGDAWEGAWTASMSRARDEEIARLDAEPPQPVKHYPFNAEQRREGREAVHVSCWHMSDTEDAAMWYVYANRGIAIRSTFARVIGALAPEEQIMAGTVSYVDFDRDAFEDAGHLLTSLVHKRAEFAFDRELRFVTFGDCASATKVERLYQIPDGTVMKSRRLVHPEVISISVNLSELIDEVVLSPEMPKWVERPIRDLLDSFGLTSVPLSPSRLGRAPTF